MKSMAAPHCNLFRRALLLLLLQSAHMAAPGVAESPAYSVQLMTGAIHPKGVEPPDVRSVVMTKKGGKKYRCYLPHGATATRAALEDAGRRDTPPPHMATFLSPLIGTCFYRLEGWWTYELCLSKSFRQFHQERSQPPSQKGGEPAVEAAAQGAQSSLPKSLGTGAITQDYTLGAYWKETVAAAVGRPSDGPPPQQRADLQGEFVDESPSKRYFKQVYGNGTACDVTGRPRESEIRVVCGPGEPSHIASIEEASTCRYVVHFRTALLCKHPAFEGDKKTEAATPIKCEPLDAEGNPVPAAPKKPSLLGADASGAPLPGTDAAQRAGLDSTAAPQPLGASSASPTETAFEVGQCFVHRRYNYRGVIIGVDRSCQQSEAWIAAMHVDALAHGRAQPFYHVLPDARDRPSGQILYVAQELLQQDTPAEPLQHALAASMFESFDASRGRYVPRQALLDAAPGSLAGSAMARAAQAAMAQADELAGADSELESEI